MAKTKRWAKKLSNSADNLLNRMIGLANSLCYKEAVKADPCSYCGVTGKKKKQVRGRDHIVPRSKGGKDTWENRTAACSRCDSRKSSTPLLFYLLENPIPADYRIEQQQLQQNLYRGY
jgi:5-methylcytosine-specific restriction endonuclease McrA